LKKNGKIFKRENDMKKIHQIKYIQFKKEKLYLTVDGKDYSFALSSVSDRLKNASQEDLRNYKISPSGYGISWPTLDEDVSIDGLIGIKHKPDRRKKPVSV
jgi:hypothetical protein